jgi:hypothetical protein
MKSSDNLISNLVKMRAFFSLCSLPLHSNYEMFLFRCTFGAVDINSVKYAIDAKTFSRLSNCMVMLSRSVFDIVEIDFFLSLFSDFVFIQNHIQNYN